MNNQKAADRFRSAKGGILGQRRKFHQTYKSIHRLRFNKSENGAALLEVLFTFLAQLFLSLGIIIFFTQVARAEIMSFQEWKKSKLEQAQIQSKSVEVTPVAAPPTTPSGASKPKTQKLEASKLALQIAQELTIDDYFALYLSQFRERSDFIDAAKKLSPSELADLLLTLKSSLGRESANESPQSLSFSNLTNPSAATKK